MPGVAERPERRRITLTIDNGPTPGITEGVLDTLAAFEIPATFFAVARDVLKSERRDLLRRVRDAGHRVGNHTMTHSVQLGATDDPGVPEREIEAAQEILREFVDDDRLFRPWGDGALTRRLLSEGAVAHLEAGGYTLALWNCVPRDWENPTGWPSIALRALEHNEWTVLVVHDTDSGSMAALPVFLEAALKDGAEFRRDFPVSCTPILRGVRVGSLAGLVNSSETTRRSDA